MRLVKILIRLRECVGWTEFSLGTHITKTRLFKYIEKKKKKKKITTKDWKFSDKNSGIFNISAQHIDCGYS